MTLIDASIADLRRNLAALNRLIDAGIDARNPRTATRELPAGRLTTVQPTATIDGRLRPVATRHH